MKLYLQVAQGVVTIILILAILLQQRGSSLSGLFGGGGEVYRTKRGLEKVLFKGTIALAAIFLILGIGILLV